MAEREGGVMINTRFPYSEQYDEENQILFNENRNGSVYHCVNCGREVVLDDSFSNQGKNMICMPCHMKEAKKLGITTFEFLNKEVWNYEL